MHLDPRTPHSRGPDPQVRRLLRRLANQIVALLLLSSCADRDAIERPAGAGEHHASIAWFDDPPGPSLAELAEVAEFGLSGRDPRDPSLATGEPDGLDGSAEVRAETHPETTPYVCERFEVRLRDNGRRWHRRLRRTWTEPDRKRFRKLVEMVAEEMGADPELLTIWALRESTYDPYAIHVLNPDLEASARSWRRHHWDADKAAELEATMAELGARDPGFWRAKAELARISRFRDNPYYDAQISFELVSPKGERQTRETSYWGYGYGPFGFNPTYFLATWDAAAPPWVFCNDDGIAAIITAVWAARAHQRECEDLGFGASNEVVNRRFSSGHCKPRPKYAEKFRTRARRRRLDPSARARLGRRWPMDSSDRAHVLGHMRTLAEARGLLSAHALH